MSDETCPNCGSFLPNHSSTCDLADKSPASYDLAEFERQLERLWQLYAEANTPASRTLADAIGAVITALKASKRDGERV